MKKLRRRTFVKTGLLGGLGAAWIGAGKASEPVSKEKAATRPGDPPKKIIIAGAGIAGLCCAYELMKAGHEVTVLEANGRHGGHVFTGRDGLSEGLHADYGADHITKPGYEKFFGYAEQFGLKAIPYPHAEGSEEAYDPEAMKMISGKWYKASSLSDPATLKQLGFNDKETVFLANNRWYDLDDFYLKSYVPQFKNLDTPFGNGLDEMDKIPVSDLFRKAGASPAALNILGGGQTSALYHLWRKAIMASRGIPASEGVTYHLKDGNQEMPNAFAKKLGARVKLQHPVTAIKRSATGITIKYKAYGRPEEMEISGDYFVNAMPLPVLRTIPVTPLLRPEKQYLIDHLSFSSHPFYVFEAESKFWLDDGLKSINMEFEHPDISSIWMETNEADTSRIVLKAYGPGGLSPQRVLAAFRKLYPGKKDTIVNALTFDWTRDKFAPTCEMESFPVGETNKFWPEIMKPDGRMYFVGTYADALSRGMESALRSGVRVAAEINAL